MPLLHTVSAKNIGLNILLSVSMGHLQQPPFAVVQPNPPASSQETMKTAIQNMPDKGITKQLWWK